MRLHLNRRAFLSGCGCLLLAGGELCAQGTKTKRRAAAPAATQTYTITRKNGPWMIMVTSLRGNSPESAAEAMKAAHNLVLELRKKGIPAWVHEQKGELEEVSSWDRSGNTVKRYVAGQRNRICVLAGEYSSIDPDDPNKTRAQHAKIAKDTLDWIQRYDPKALANGKFQPTPGRPGPLSRAFLTLNPMFTEEEIAQIAYDKDPLLKSLNQDDEYDLLRSKGKYSLVVATFQGASKHVVANGGEDEKKAIFKFDSMLEKNISLDKAGQRAWTLVRILRNKGHEAYVYHERFRSVVTVGSFNDPNDPRVAKTIGKYGAKMKPDARTRQEVLTPEIFQTENDIFLLDLTPQLMKVPKFK